MISFLNNDDVFFTDISFSPMVVLNHLLPQRYKFMPESYVLKDKKNIRALITVAPSKNPLKQLEIHKLLFQENNYHEAEELIQYVVSKYKANGVVSFIVKIDDYLSDLIRLFIAKCGFSQISYEKLWMNKEYNSYTFEELSEKYNSKMFRGYRGSDVSVVSNMYNEQLLPHIRPLLGKDVKDFKDSFYAGLRYYTEYKYVYRDKNTKNIHAFLFIRSVDNTNFVLDIIQSSWDDINLDELLAFAYAQVKKRTQKAKLYIKSKKYIQQYEKYEKELIDKNFECVQNKAILTNSSAKIIKNESESVKYTVLSQFYSGLSITNKSQVK